MDALLPQAYLIGLIVLLGGSAVLVGRQILRVRRDELTLARLEGTAKTDRAQGAKGAKGGEAPAVADSATLYELASVQLRKRLYDQADDSLRKALRLAEREAAPAEARALIENALGFCLAARGNYKVAIRHYRAALEAKADYPVALNNLAYALEKQLKPEEARSAYEQALAIDGTNRTARKRLKRLERNGV
ncbi:MAG: tetratricopeptide repeat protein [Cyanobacteriota bacterium]|nr:tetratricopeptide repeat protein [Cyanobacteriota bacterium]